MTPPKNQPIFISIHALCGEGDVLVLIGARKVHISIHALRGEGDAVLRLNCGSVCHFYPRPPWGGRPTAWANAQRLMGFLSTPSVGRATTTPQGLASEVRISIHALRGEGDRPTSKRPPVTQNFYPRPPWGGRLAAAMTWLALSLFLSTPSVGRATQRTELIATAREFLSTPSVGRATQR